MDLRTRAIKATGWYLAARIWTQALSWAVTIVLARLLMPEDYGLFGMSLAVISFLEILQQFGLGVVVIQRKSLDRAQLNTIFWAVLGMSALAAGGAWAGAGWVAGFYAEPRLVGIVRALAMILILNAIGMVPYNLLTKEIDFRRRSWAESAGVMAGMAVSVCLAWTGQGVWALVAGELVRTVVRNGGMLALCRWWPGVELSSQGMGEIFRFGFNVAGATILRELSSVANSAIIGRSLGGHALGLYSMAGSIGLNPFQKLSTAVVSQLSFPVFSKIQEDTEQLQRYFLKVTKYLAVIAMPLQLGMALVSADLVLVVLSEKWHSIVGLLQVLCVGGIWYVLPMPAPPVLTARGHASTMFRFHALFFVVMAVSFLIGVRFGLPGVAVAWAVGYGSLRTILVGLSLRELRLSWASYLANIAGPTSAALVMTGAVLLVRVVTPALDGSVERLVRDVLVGVVVYSAVLLLRDRHLGLEMKSIAQALVSKARA